MQAQEHAAAETGNAIIKPQSALREKCLRPGNADEAAEQAIANAEQALQQLSVNFDEWMASEATQLANSRDGGQGGGLCRGCAHRAVSGSAQSQGAGNHTWLSFRRRDLCFTLPADRQDGRHRRNCRSYSSISTSTRSAPWSRKVRKGMTTPRHRFWPNACGMSRTTFCSNSPHSRRTSARRVQFP